MVFDFVVFELILVVFLEDGGFVEFVEVSVDVVEGVLFDVDGVDVFVLDFFYYLDRVFDGCFNGW